MVGVICCSYLYLFIFCRIVVCYTVWVKIGLPLALVDIQYSIINHSEHIYLFTRGLMIILYAQNWMLSTKERTLLSGSTWITRNIRQEQNSLEFMAEEQVKEGFGPGIGLDRGIERQTEFITLIHVQNSVRTSFLKESFFRLI